MCVCGIMLYLTRCLCVCMYDQIRRTSSCDLDRSTNDILDSLWRCLAPQTAIQSQRSRGERFVSYTSLKYFHLDPLMGTANYSATWNKMKLVHWPLMRGLLHLVQRGGNWAGPQPALPNVTAHPSTASVPITVLMYNELMIRCSAVLMCPLKG